MNTWNDAEPPVLPSRSAMQRVRGTLRLLALCAMTLALVPIFLLGRWVRGAIVPSFGGHFWIARQWSRGCLALCGLSLRVQGTPIPAGALVANHAGWLDILPLRSVGLIYFVSKAEVMHWPIIGFITRITGTVFIERRRSEIKAQEMLLRERIEAGDLLCFFPEGTSTDGLRVVRFKTALFSAFYPDGVGTDALIQPVSVRYQPGAATGLPDSFFGWWGDMPLEPHIWEVLCRSRGGTVDVIFHEPLRCDAFPDRKAIAEACERMVRDGHQNGRPSPAAIPEREAHP